MGPTKLATEAADVRAIAELVQRTWSFDTQWHIGDVAWGPGQWFDRGDSPMALWMGAAGRTDAWGWVEQPETLYLVVDPARAELVEDVLVWFEGLARGPQFSVTVLEREWHLIRGLRDRGYERSESPFFLHMRRELVDLPVPKAPEGFTARPITPEDLPERVRVHRAAWEPSILTEASFRRVTECWPYRFDLDWIVEHRGTFVASCLAWFDEAHGVGELEPVGTDPRFRRMGLGRLACLAAMHALRRCGAREAIVYARGDSAYPVPARMYKGLGFEAYARTWTYRRSAPA